MKRPRLEQEPVCEAIGAQSNGSTEMRLCPLSSPHLKPIWRIVKIDKIRVRRNRLKDFLNLVLLSRNWKQTVAIGASSLKNFTTQCFAQLVERSLATICECGMEFYWNSAACLPT